MDRYVDVARNDLPYWYNEWANVGCLAAAAWNLGGVALEEYSVGDGSDTRTAAARCDLRIWVPKLGLDCEIEAKFVRQGSLEVVLQEIHKLIGHAEDQLRGLPRNADRAPTGIALCFVCPEVRTTGDGREILKRLLDEFGDQKNSHLLAVYEPQPGAPIKYEDEKYGRYFYPGVALVGRIAWNMKQTNPPSVPLQQQNQLQKPRSIG